MVARKKTSKPATSRSRSVSQQTKPNKRALGRRAQNKQAIRNRIVKAALNLFQTKGFDGTTTRAIARKAGIAEGTVFNYFRTKEDIALYFFEQEVGHAVATVRDNPKLLLYRHFISTYLYNQVCYYFQWMRTNRVVRMIVLGIYSSSGWHFIYLLN